MTLYFHDIGLYEIITTLPPAIQNDTWTRQNNRALSIFHNACEQPVQEKFMDAENAKEAWDTLMVTYEAKTASVMNRLLDEFSSAKKKPTETC